MLPLIKFAYRRLNGLIFVSNALRKAFIENNNFNPHDVLRFIIHCSYNSKYKRKIKPSNKKVILGLGILERETLGFIDRSICVIN